MLRKRIAALALAAVMACTAVVPAVAAGTSAPAAQALAEDNALVAIRIEATDNAVYGSPINVTIRATPEDTQYIAVVLGVSGEAKGFVTLLLPKKVRILLELIPLPNSMAADPANTTNFNLYRYLKQLIDGNDVSVLIRVAEELTALMAVLQYYVPALQNVVTGMNSALELIRRYLPEGLVTHIYMDEQPVDSGSYVAGAVTLNKGDVNTGGLAIFKVARKSEGVRQYWSQQTPAAMTVEEAQNFDFSAVVEVDGAILQNPRVSYTYKKKGGFLGLGGQTTSEPPTDHRAGRIHPDCGGGGQLHHPEHQPELYHHRLTAHLETKAPLHRKIGQRGFFCGAGAAKKPRRTGDAGAAGHLAAFQFRRESALAGAAEQRTARSSPCTCR